MTLHRFLVPSLSATNPVGPPRHVVLPDAEAHHASRVLRCQIGTRVVLFDGVGHEAFATIESIDKRSVTATLESVAFAPRDHDNRLHFAVAMPKGDRQRSAIEKLVELGVDSLCPLVTSRSVAVVTESNAQRLERYVIEACKQCGRNRLMTIRAPLSINDIDSTLSRDGALWILHPHSIPERHPAFSIREANQNAFKLPYQQLFFLIGPEGGFTDAEVTDAANQGAHILTLGERIQRVETAVSTAAVLGHCWLAVAEPKGDPEVRNPSALT